MAQCEIRQTPRGVEVTSERWVPWLGQWERRTASVKGCKNGSVVHEGESGDLQQKHGTEVAEVEDEGPVRSGGVKTHVVQVAEVVWRVTR